MKQFLKLIVLWSLFLTSNYCVSASTDLLGGVSVSQQDYDTQQYNEDKSYLEDRLRSFHCREFYSRGEKNFICFFLTQMPSVDRINNDENKRLIPLIKEFIALERVDYYARTVREGRHSAYQWLLFGMAAPLLATTYEPQFCHSVNAAIFNKFGLVMGGGIGLACLCAAKPLHLIYRKGAFSKIASSLLAAGTFGAAFGVWTLATTENPLFALKSAGIGAVIGFGTERMGAALTTLTVRA